MHPISIKRPGAPLHAESSASYLYLMHEPTLPIVIFVPFLNNEQATIFNVVYRQCCRLVQSNRQCKSAFMTGIGHLVQHFCRYKKPRGDILLFLFRDTISDNIEPCEKRFFTATRYFHMRSGFSASVTDKV